MSFINGKIWLIDIEHDLNITIKCIKMTFSNKQIVNIKKKMHIDPICTYYDSEIESKVLQSF